MKTKVLALIAAAAAIAACTAPEDAPRLRKISKTSESIVGGSNVTDYSFPQVVYIEGNGYLCSGTLIDDFVVLTAAHCVEDSNAANYTICGGDEPYGAGCQWLVPAESVHAAPGYDPNVVGANDIGIIVLKPHPQYGGPHDQDPNLVPLPFLAQDPGTVYEEDSPFTAVGFGITGVSDQSDPIKRTVDLAMSQNIYSDVFEYGGPSANTCSGDSGGPALKTVGGTQTVIGVVSYGDQNCTQFGGDSRTDYNPYEDFIASFAGAGATPTPTPAPGDDDDDGTTPGDDDDDDGNGADDPLGNIGCSIAGATSVARSPFGFLAALAMAALVARRRE